MKTVFPEAPGLYGMFFTGYKKFNGACVFTGTVIIKRSYRIDAPGNGLVPLPEHYPVFVTDYPFNLVKNSCFEDPAAGPPSDWQADGAVVQSVTESGIPLMRVHSAAPGMKILQTIELEQPLGGRSFVLSFWAKSGALPAAIRDVQLAAGADGICAVSGNLTGAFKRYAGQGTWPAHVESKKMDVVLRTTTLPGKNIDYTGIQIEEGTQLTYWDGQTILKYEHDLAPFKEQADLIVLGYGNNIENCRVKVNDAIRMQWTAPVPVPSSFPGDIAGTRKALFGWEPRVNSAREAEAGVFPTEAGAYPMEPPLPAGFQNSFYNGYLREPHFSIAGNPYLMPDDLITIERPASVPYRFYLPGEAYKGSYYCTVPSAPDDAAHWLKKDFPLYADTLVLEPEKAACYIVWRGHWPFHDHPQDAYRLLEVTKYRAL